jgi:hypothetical protein
MDNNDLKSMWQDAHYKNTEDNFSEESFEKTLTLKHSKVISKSLADVKIKVLLSTLIFIVYTGLMLYAIVYLGLNLSINSLVPLALVGIFLLITASSEFVRLLVLTRTVESLSLKDSILTFGKKLKRIKTTDFVVYMVFFYMLLVMLIYNYLTDIGGIKNLTSGNNIIPAPLLAILILMLLSIPWFIKYLNNRRYRKLFSNLTDSVSQLNDK